MSMLFFSLAYYDTADLGNYRIIHPLQLSSQLATIVGVSHCEVKCWQTNLDMRWVHFLPATILFTVNMRPP